MTTTAIDMDNIEYEVRKTTELIREMTVKLAERDKMQEQAEEQKKAVKQFTDQVNKNMRGIWRGGKRMIHISNF